MTTPNILKLLTILTLINVFINNSENNDEVEAISRLQPSDAVLVRRFHDGNYFFVFAKENFDSLNSFLSAYEKNPTVALLVEKPRSNSPESLSKYFSALVQKEKFSNNIKGLKNLNFKGVQYTFKIDNKEIFSCTYGECKEPIIHIRDLKTEDFKNITISLNFFGNDEDIQLEYKPIKFSATELYNFSKDEDFERLDDSIKDIYFVKIKSFEKDIATLAAIKKDLKELKYSTVKRILQQKVNEKRIDLNNSLTKIQITQGLFSLACPIFVVLGVFSISFDFRKISFKLDNRIPNDDIYTSIIFARDKLRHNLFSLLTVIFLPVALLAINIINIDVKTVMTYLSNALINDNGIINIILPTIGNSKAIGLDIIFSIFLFSLMLAICFTTFASLYNYRKSKIISLKVKEYYKKNAEPTQKMIVKKVLARNRYQYIIKNSN